MSVTNILPAVYGFLWIVQTKQIVIFGHESNIQTPFAVFFSVNAPTKESSRGAALEIQLSLFRPAK